MDSTSARPVIKPHCIDYAKVLPAAPGCESILTMVREMSTQTDPQEMVEVFRRKAIEIYGGDGSMSLSRRGLEYPRYRMTRNTQWERQVDPWKHPEKLPLYTGGVLADLIYADKPVVLTDVCIVKDDPAYAYLSDMRSLVALPLFDQGTAMNMVVRYARDAKAFSTLNLADALLTANMFGRATNNLVMARRLEAAYAALDRELAQVGQIQRSLLPAQLPVIDGADVAASYTTAARAGGDYYDFFELPNGRWGFVIADVSGHGTPAAVVMAMLRALLHSKCLQNVSPSEVLSFANANLCDQSDRYDGTFVTAFFGIYDSQNGDLRYACAGHNPPIVVDRKIRVRELDDVQSLPLAIEPKTTYPESSTRLRPGDTLLLYTDGITEAVNLRGEMYGVDRLLTCVHEEVPNAQHIIDCVTMKLIGFTGGSAQADDQTLVAIRVAGD